MTTTELDLTAVAVGGEAVGRDPDGRVVFVHGGVPGDRVLVEITEAKKRFARGQVIEVLDPSSDRVEPPCPHVAQGCGGCSWQHVAPRAQRTLRTDQVREALQRLAGIAEPKVELGPDLAADGLRTTVRGVADADGRFAFHRHHSHDLVAVDSCMVSHPLIEEVIRAGRFPAGHEVLIRAGSRTGERLVVLSGPETDAHELVSVPTGVNVVTKAQLASGRRAWIHEECAGRRWRVSAGSFFQASPEGAEALVSTVDGFIQRSAPNAERLVDMCAGVGLFAGTVGQQLQVVAVESNRVAVADARHNLADIDARVIRSEMRSWRASRADVVVADPARVGLERPGVAAVAATGAGLCVLVSCEVGSLGRDARLLQEAGYRHQQSVTIDLFGHTGRVETVSAFTLEGQEP